MTTFAGYSLPIKYKGMIDEQKACRNSVALFDVSHMGPALIKGKQAAQLIQSKMVVDLSRLKNGDAAYSLITNDKFGIVDDAVITKLNDDQYYIVYNGARKEVDKAYFQDSKFKPEIRMMDQDHCLLALQGPQAEDALVRVFDKQEEKIRGLKFMQTFIGNDGYVTRCGYTGEDGFQILIKNSAAEEFCQKLLESGEVEPAGLGARDILRTQAGLCLYGQDIDQQTTPIEAGLIFTISKRRRQEGGFPGYQVFVDQYKNKSYTKKRVGFVMEDQKHLKPGHIILSEKAFEERQDLIVGAVTSGTFSPTLGKGIGIGYVQKEFDKAETSLYARISKSKAKRLDLKKMPLLPSKIKK